MKPTSPKNCTGVNNTVATMPVQNAAVKIDNLLGTKKSAVLWNK
jgi:hypothetical protein